MISQTLRTSTIFSKKALACIQICLASCLMAIFAHIKIPLYFTPVPLTGQTIALMLIAATLSPKKSALAAILYITQGALGLPVFAGGTLGLSCLLGPTGGYILFYPIQAYLFAYLFRSQIPLKTIAAIVIPSSLQLLIGSFWLAMFVGAKNSLALGFYPFIFLELFKALAICSFLKFKTNR